LKLCEITIKPKSAFGTPLKGDTLFGQFCWQTVYDADLLTGGLEKRLSEYHENPFAIFSSAVLKLSSGEYVLKRPDMPLTRLFDIADQECHEFLKQKKEKKKQKWMIADKSLSIDLAQAEYQTDKELFKRMSLKDDSHSFIIPFSQQHNTINRLTQTTGKDAFAPYTQEIFYYPPDVSLAIFVLIDESVITIENMKKALSDMGKCGYGKDASIGMGRFDVEKCQVLTLPNMTETTACYTLAPCVPQKNVFSESWFTPFVRYGKHGDKLATSRNPFKNPVIMADEGAVFKADKEADIWKKPYIGCAIRKVSLTEKEAVVQGYAPYLPIKLKD